MPKLTHYHQVSSELPTGQIVTHVGVAYQNARDLATKWRRQGFHVTPVVKGCARAYLKRTRPFPPTSPHFVDTQRCERPTCIIRKQKPPKHYHVTQTPAHPAWPGDTTADSFGAACRYVATFERANPALVPVGFYYDREYSLNLTKGAQRYHLTIKGCRNNHENPLTPT